MARMHLALALLAFTVACPAQSSQDLGPFTTVSDIGDLGRHSLVTHDRSSGIYFISAAGENLWGERDAFGFVSKEVKGDVQIGARVRFMGKSAQPHRKAGVMLRQSLAADSAYVDAVIHGDGLTSLQYRVKTGGPTREIQCAQEAPVALRLERRGDYVQLFTSNEDGVFSATGCQVRVALGSKVHAGLAVCAHDDQAFENARFSSVTLGAPPPRRATRVSAIEMAPVDSLSRRILWYSTGRLEVPSFTAQGDAICFRESGELKRLSLSGRSEPTRVAGDNLPSCEPALAPISAGQRLVHRVDRGRARIWLEPTEGEPRPLTHGHLNHWQPRVAPDAASFVYLAGAARPVRGRAGAGDYLLIRRPLADGEERVLAEIHGDASSLGISPWSPDGQRVVFMSREPE